MDLESSSLKTQGFETFANKKGQDNIYSSISNFLRSVTAFLALHFFLIYTNKTINFPSSTGFCYTL